MEKKNIQYKNTKISYSEQGQGATIVFLHGFLESSNMWDYITPHFLKTNRVLCVDLLGHGDSGCLGYVHTIDEMADAVFAVIKHLRLRKVCIVGHSMGGYVALSIAEKHPSYIKKLGLVNSTAQADSEERKVLRNRAIEMAKASFNQLVSMSITNLFSVDSRKLYGDRIEKLKNEALQMSPQAYIAATQAMQGRVNKEHILKANASKSLFILGEQDTVLNSEIVIEQAKRNQVSYEILKGGHMSFIEAELPLINVLKNFILKK